MKEAESCEFPVRSIGAVTFCGHMRSYGRASWSPTDWLRIWQLGLVGLA